MNTTLQIGHTGQLFLRRKVSRMGCENVLLRNIALGVLRLTLMFGPVALMSSCGRQSSEIAVIPRTCGTWLWEAEHTGVALDAPAYGLAVYWNAPMREDDVQGQIEILARSVQRRVGGVIISPIQDLPLRTPLQRTIRAGIPVVVVATDLGLAPGRNLSYVLNDEKLGGQLAARRIGLILKGSGSVAILGINKELSSTADRARSLEAGLANEFPGIHVVHRSLALPTVSQEQQVAEKILAGDTPPDLIVALSEASTRGAFFALIESNKNGKLPLIGFDQNLLAPIRSGDIDSVILLDTFAMGKAAIKLISEEREGRTAQERVLVEPELVTRETIDSARVRQAMDLAWYRR